jgi:hypothetical protein
MDEIVRAALKKWPQVPACRGWLGLDARGDWYMRDDPIQAQGAFPHPKGSRIQHDKLIDFIARNYEADDAGAWFFQNGPQRVYVELEAAPWVWRLQVDAADAGAMLIRSHTGRAAQHRAAWLDEQDRLFVETDLGLGIVHSMDMGEAALAVESGEWRPETMPFGQMPGRFGYVLSPQAAPGPNGG